MNTMQVIGMALILISALVFFALGFFFGKNINKFNVSSVQQPTAPDDDEEFKKEILDKIKQVEGKAVIKDEYFAEDDEEAYRKEEEDAKLRGLK